MGCVLLNDAIFANKGAQIVQTATVCFLLDGVKTSYWAALMALDGASVYVPFAVDGILLSQSSFLLRWMFFCSDCITFAHLRHIVINLSIYRYIY